jgi:hypothetical protein
LARNHSRPRVSRVANTLSYIVVLGGVVTIALSLYLVFASYSSLPFYDAWGQIDFAANEGTAHTFDWLWRQYNQHRLVIPKLFLLADLHWFQARQVFSLTSIFAIQLLLLGLLGWSMRVLGGWRGALWRTGFGLGAFCLFCPSQWGNFVWGFQTCFVLPGLFATLSFAGLLLYWVRAGQAKRWKYLLVSIVGALGASYSLSNGNLLWPLLVAAALLLRLPLRATLAYATAGVVSTAVYLTDYTRPSPEPLGTPGAILRYVATYFGSSWLPSHTRSVAEASGVQWIPSNLRLAEILGAAGILIFVYFLLQVPSYIRERRPFCIQLVLLLCFCLGTGLVTALARVVFGTGQAFSSRYQTVALLFWCCMGLLLLASVSELRKIRDVPLLQAGVLAVMLFAAYWVETPIVTARLQGFHLNAAGMALVTDVPDMDELQWANFRPEVVLSLAPFMRQERLSVFSQREPSLLGKPLDSMFTVVPPSDCTGKIGTSTAITDTWPRSLRITGWAWDYKDRRPPSEIVITNNGIISGLGAVGDWRSGNKLGGSWAANFTGYTGYVRDVRESSVVQVYAILRDKKSVCYLATLGAAEH